MSKLSRLLLRIFRWIKERYQGSYSESLASYKEEIAEENRKEYNRKRNQKLMQRYSGSRAYTPAPPIHHY